jgi:hypothetical protein
MQNLLRSKLVLVLTSLILVAAFAVAFVATGSATHAASQTFPASGNLDCNGFSTIQKPLKAINLCTDPKGFNNTRFEDNGHYVGHDEPAVQFNSTVPGSGNNVQYTLSLPKENPLPATQTFQNGIAFWFSMALCDPNSFPQGACIPDSDQNNPNRAGSGFLEMQFYPPGSAPFISNVSCDLVHWCASLHINTLECTLTGVGGAFCNPRCIEPTNFAFIQMDGIPTGPAGPDTATVASFTPNAQTLLMNQGDALRVTINDTPGNVFGGVTTRIDDLTTHQSGFMIASAHNGFRTLDPHSCLGTNFSFHPEFSTARFGNFVPWAALQANIGFSDEIGHWENFPGDGDADDTQCFPAGPDNLVGGCLAFAGDDDFDGTPYQADYPDGSKNGNVPTPVNFAGPLFAVNGAYKGAYPTMQFETEVGASESTCQPTGDGCTVPPAGAQFYPFFSVANEGIPGCTFEFGNITNKVDDFGGDAQYGASNVTWFFGQISSGPRANPC